MEAPAPQPVDRSSLVRLVRLAAPYWGVLSLAALCMLVATGSFLAIPYAIRLLTDTVFVHHDAAGLNRVTLLLLGVVLLSAAFGYGRGYFLNYVGGRVVADLRIGLYRHMLELPLAFYDERRSGDLLSRLTADATLVQTVLSEELLSLFQNLITILAVVVVVIVLDWRLALVTVAVAPVIVLVGYLVGRRTRRLSNEAQGQLGEATVVLEETLPAMRVVKAFGREPSEGGRYAGAVERSFRTGLAAARLQSLFGSVMLTAIMVAVAAVLWFGGQEVLARRLSPGGLISFLFYLTMLIGPMQGLAGIYASFQRAAGGAARVFEVLDTPPTITDSPRPRRLRDPAGRVEFGEVRFRYAEGLPDVLHDVSLIAEPGETVAIVGPSGAGKTTLVSLIPRFYDVTGGAVRVDGWDIRDVTLASLRRPIAIVPQEATLFGGTVRENIAYGREGATEGEIEGAARAANAHGFIEALPHGYNSIVGDRGVKLSGGQRQRIAIARAILRDPRILILDEATSSLDNESEALVQEALERLMTGRTTFVIAHRLTTVENADRIVVLDAGRVVEEGTHTSLMARDTLYRRLYTRSFGAEPELVG